MQQVLMALVPYSRENMKLSFRPVAFFIELEKHAVANRRTLEVTYSKAKQMGLIEVVDGRPYLTEAGEAKIAMKFPPFLTGGRWLMVIFDVPEERKADRQRLRSYLKELGYKPLQKSVWVSERDNLNLVKAAVADLRLGRMVAVLRCEPLFPTFQFENLADSLQQV